MTHDAQPLTDAERDHFDGLLETVLRALPEHVYRLFNEVPLVVEDYPSDEVSQSFALAHRDELCGLHDGVPLTERSVADTGRLPDHIMLYREGIIASSADARGEVRHRELRRQIQITVLHELGHHFGLDEAELEAMGYG
jgi:predicted Zn-dependent protease with MMP-like domain